jgi:Ca2+-binding RTX toxin-like protein
VSGDFSAASNSIEQIDVSGVLGTELFTSVNSVTDLSGIDVLGELMIQGSTGNDTIIGSSGNDTIAGDGGLNNLSGGAGDDTFIFERGGSGNGTNIINGGLGFDRIQITQNDTLIRFSGGFDASNSLEQIDATGLTGTRVIISESNVVHDFSATTILGAVTIVGSTGDDTIVGSTADDTIVGNGGLNNLSGGGGDDVFLLDRSGFGNGANILDGGLGFDQVQVTANDAFIRFSGGFDASNSIEQIDASGVTGTIVNIFQSNVVHDFSSTTILGDVIVRGSTGADTIIGSSGNDNIEGSVGNDQIAGGVGDDLLTGGVGADIFVFDAGFGSDTITDFEGGLDSLDFTGTGLTFNDLSISQVGTDTVIDDGLGNTITLIGITATTIDQNDFLF